MRQHVRVKYQQFEREFLRLAFTTEIELSPAALAFVTAVPIATVGEHFNTLIGLGILELSSDDDGRMLYEMPTRPKSPLALDDPALVGLQQVTVRLLPAHYAHQAPPQAIVVRGIHPMTYRPPETSSGQAVAALCLNAMVCPGLGSLVGGKTRAGAAQLGLFLLGLPLAFIALGLPLMLAAWVWGIATGAQLMTEASELSHPKPR